MYVGMYVHMFVRMHTYIRMYTYMHQYMDRGSLHDMPYNNEKYIYIHTYIWAMHHDYVLLDVYTCIYTYMYVYAHAHTCIHTTVHGSWQPT